MYPFLEIQQEAHNQGVSMDGHKDGSVSKSTCCKTNNQDSIPGTQIKVEGQLHNVVPCDTLCIHIHTYDILVIVVLIIINLR